MNDPMCVYSSTGTADATGAVLSRSGLPLEQLREMIEQSAEHLKRLSGAALLITGATGWLGTWLLDYLCEADTELGLNLRIFAVSRDPRGFLSRYPRFRKDHRLAWIESDVRNLHGVTAKFSHVIHAATDSTPKVGRSSGPVLLDSIVEGTRRVLACAGADCQGFLMVSSGAVYGPAVPGTPRFLDSQQVTLAPSLPGSYAQGKRAAERLCAIAAAEGVPVRIGRCFAFLGPHMPFDQHFAIGNFIADAASSRPILIKSDGQPQRSYLYSSDWVRALLSVLLDGVNGRTYNVGSEAALTLKQLADRVDLVVGGRGVVVTGVPSTVDDRYVPDTTRLRSELKFSPMISLDAAISRTAAWYRGMARRSMTS